MSYYKTIIKVFFFRNFLLCFFQLQFINLLFCRYFWYIVIFLCNWPGSLFTSLIPSICFFFVFGCWIFFFFFFYCFLSRDILYVCHYYFHIDSFDIFKCFISINCQFLSVNMFMLSHRPLYNFNWLWFFQLPSPTYVLSLSSEI